MVRKSSARVSDADIAAKIDSAVFQYFTGGGFCRFFSPHGNDKEIRRRAMALRETKNRHALKRDG